MRTLILALSLSFFPLLLSASCIKGNCQNGNGIYLKKNGVKYIGPFKRGKFTGKGTLIFPNGDKYVGTFKRGFRTGFGKLYYASGDLYMGQFVNGIMEGKGRMDYADGAQYKGEWKSGLPSGQGEYTFTNKELYKGTFLAGKFNGKGSYHFTDGSSFTGEWKNNQKHGQGVYLQANGQRISGKWSNDEFISGREESVAVSKKNKPKKKPSSAVAQQTYKDCGAVYCHDEIGYLVYADGSRYTGNFRNGNPEGIGICEYANGDKYDGGWANHGPHGEGLMTFASGQTYGAIWNQGKPEKQIFDNKKYFTGKVSSGKKAFDKEVNVYALIVGIASYSHLPSLKYTDDDAYRVYAFLKSPEGGAIQDENIEILIDDVATRSNIIASMNKLTAKADENDVVIMYLSGHGLEGSFVPSDFDGYRNHLPYSDVLDIFNSSDAKHKLCITDACHSGSMFAARAPYSSALANFYTEYADKSGGTAILTSSKSEEVSLEYSGLRQGVFSHFLIKGLKGYADKDNNKIITVSELYAYIYNNVKSYTANGQTPLLEGDFDPEMPVGLIR